MKNQLFPAFCLASLASACCVTTGTEVRQQIVSANKGEREHLFAPLRALEGRWEEQAPDGTVHAVEFELTSKGTALRETMLPGSENEMINMYTLDGNALRMTHYCAGGNQPHLIGRLTREGRYEFESEVVTDLKQADEMYMGSMTLVLVDADHIEEHWKALRSGKVDHEMVFKLTRKK
jgi:hypothetical protein